MEVARHFAEALTLLQRREGNPVDPATLSNTGLAGLLRLQEVRSVFGHSAAAVWARQHVIDRASVGTSAGASSRKLQCRACIWGVYLPADHMGAGQKVRTCKNWSTQHATPTDLYCATCAVALCGS